MNNIEMPSILQSVVFERDKGWTVESSKKWVSQHDYKTSFPGKPGPDIKPMQIRYRQTPPNFSNYATKKLPGGILLIFGLR